MLRVDEIALREIRLPLREPFRISSGVTSERRICLLELRDSDNVRVWAECVAGEGPNYSPETIETAWLAITRWGAPRVLGRTFAGPGEVRSALQRNFRGHEMAKAAIEMGYWALAAELQDRPLASLIGGERQRVPVGISLGIQPNPAALVERASAARAAGYRKIKLKIEPAADIEFVAAVREALGADAPLMADANNSYTLADADHLAKLDEFGLVMIEQPLEREDLVRHAELQRRIRTPVALDESITSLARAEDMVALGSGRIINIKPGRVGGFAESLAIHEFAMRSAIAVFCGGMLESGIGRAYNIALASLPNFLIPGDTSPSARYWTRDIVSPEWEMDAAGTIGVPTGRGLGVTVDADRIDDLTVRREVLTAR